MPEGYEFNGFATMQAVGIPGTVWVSRVAFVYTGELIGPSYSYFSRSPTCLPCSVLYPTHIPLTPPRAGRACITCRRSYPGLLPAALAPAAALSSPACSSEPAQARLSS